MRLRIAFRTSFIVLSLLLTGGNLQVSGQKLTDGRTSTRSMVTIAMIKKGDYLIVDAQLNGKTRKFILDGSSERTLLNSKHLYPVTDVPGRIKRHSVQSTGSNILRVNRIDFHGIKLNKSGIETMDMSYIENATGIKVYGILGYDLIKSCDLEFNYKEQTITLFNPKKHNTSVPPAYKKKNQWVFPFITL